MFDLQPKANSINFTMKEYFFTSLIYFFFTIIQIWSWLIQLKTIFSKISFFTNFLTSSSSGIYSSFQICFTRFGVVIFLNSWSLDWNYVRPVLYNDTVEGVRRILLRKVMTHPLRHIWFENKTKKSCWFVYLLTWPIKKVIINMMALFLFQFDFELVSQQSQKICCSCLLFLSQQQFRYT